MITLYIEESLYDLEENERPLPYAEPEGHLTDEEIATRRAEWQAECVELQRLRDEAAKERAISV